ncbi:unnamed protein product [Symbiodinium natans]|uniref:Uncharacterized protein n=1 Tax=Symbiodinium natans TaxID=878477 RepID=A0A812LWA3_9DINO|nr:unnamed protein product [Symbiodinium natans]
MSYGSKGQSQWTTKDSWQSDKWKGQSWKQGDWQQKNRRGSAGNAWAPLILQTGRFDQGRSSTDTLDLPDAEEATEEDLSRQAQQDVEREDQAYSASVWKEAIERAHHSVDRPPSARELVQMGRLKDFWSMTWTQARGEVSADSVEACKRALNEVAISMPDQTFHRLAAVLAAFMDGGRSPMGEDGKLRAMRTRMPGAEGVIISTMITGPSYTKCDDHRHDLVMAHGTGFVHAIGIGLHGEVCPNDSKPEDYPRFGFSGRGTLEAPDPATIEAAFQKTVAHSKGPQGVIFVYQGELEKPTHTTEGGVAVRQRRGLRVQRTAHNPPSTPSTRFCVPSAARGRPR